MWEMDFRETGRRKGMGGVMQRRGEGLIRREEVEVNYDEKEKEGG